MNLPFHISYDETSSSLFVGDSSNNRVLRFAAPAAPTAATVTVSGRVSTGRRGASGAVVLLTGADGITRRVLTDALGNYRFDNVAAGETYILRATVKRFEYAPQVVYVTEDAGGVNFTSN